MKVSFLFPEKNQGEKLIQHLLDEIIPYLDKMPFAYDAIICPNGCSEEEVAFLTAEAPKLPLQVKILPNAMPGGKGEGIKKGIEASNSDFVCFMDADMATDLDVLQKFVPLFAEYDAIIASRDCKDSVYVQKQPFKRRLTHFAGRKLIRWTLHMPFKDTQCGFKAYKTDVAKIMVKHQRFRGFSFDLEYLYFLVINGFKVAEVGCKWKDDPDSTISKKSVFTDFYKDMKAIKKDKGFYLMSEEEKKSLGGKAC